jgi:probable F420-dependent oxidoreductase
VEAFGATFFEAATVMAYLAGITERVQIGAAILIVPYRHPLLLAKSLATADQLSRGRLILGAGLGWLETESALMGVPHRKRARIADETLAVMRACWESERPEFHGDVYDFGGFHFAPRPYQDRRLPVLVGGATTAALRRAVRLGDGWIGDGQTFEELEVSLEHLDRELSAASRSRDSRSSPIATRSQSRLRSRAGKAPSSLAPAARLSGACAKRLSRTSGAPPRSAWAT